NDDSISRTVYYYPSGSIKSFSVNIPFYEIGEVDTVVAQWQTGTGSAVSLNGTAVNENGNVPVRVDRDTILSLVAQGESSDTVYIPVIGVISEKYNRAFHRSMMASTTDWGYSVNDANDGNDNTFWKSAAGKTQWVSVDFGKTISVKNIRLLWGSVYGTTYYLYLLKETGEANVFYNTSTGDGGKDSISGITGYGRTFKILCLKNNTVDDPYILKEIEVYGTKGVTSIGSEESIHPVQFSLYQNYPNPFNPMTTFTYSIPANGGNSLPQNVSLMVFDMLGKKVTTLVNEKKESGIYTANFDGSQLASGVYVAQLRYGAAMQARTMLLLK
ncbi:MAG: discoidin domain-containing protein, partial [Bacteroidota bacterium]